MATTFFKRVGGVVHADNETWGTPGAISLTSFYGGAKYGRSLQITVDGHAAADCQFVGLTRDDVQQLVTALMLWMAVGGEQLDDLSAQLWGPDRG